MTNKGPTDAKRKPKKTAKVIGADEGKQGSRKGKQKTGKGTKNTSQAPASDGNGTDEDEDANGVTIE
jgi:hypothetical protein